MTNHLCFQCNANLTGDEISLYKKLISRSADQFLCLDCMAAGMHIDRIKLEKLIDYYHSTGICCLFAKYES